ncbi:3214_t:CDS:1, partial [Racocetra fulgida]
FLAVNFVLAENINPRIGERLEKRQGPKGKGKTTPDNTNTPPDNPNTPPDNPGVPTETTTTRRGFRPSTSPN